MRSGNGDGVVDGVHTTNPTNRKTRRQSKMGEGEEPQLNDDDDVQKVEDGEPQQSAQVTGSKKVIVQRKEQKVTVSDRKSGKKLSGRKRKIKEEPVAAEEESRSDSGISDVSTQASSSKRVRHPPTTKKNPRPARDEDDGLYCSKCFLHCSDRSQLLQHENSCFLGRRYPCVSPGCTHTNSQKSHMMQHYRTEHMGMPFQCSFCEETTTYKKSRDKHEKTVHKKISEHPSDDEFQYESAIKEHLAGQEANSDSSDDKPEAPQKVVTIKKEPKKKGKAKKVAADGKVVFKYSCTAVGCDFETDDKTQFTGHLAKHIEVLPFSCNFCKKSYAKQSGLSKHLRVCEEARRQHFIVDEAPVRENPKQQQEVARPSFECSVTTCGKVFTSENQYREHFKSQHVDNVKGEVYYCELCICRLFTEKGFGHHMNNH